MTEGSFKFILIFIPVLLWCTPLQDRIYNYSSIPQIQYQESLIQAGLLFNTNKDFTSYAIYSQIWVSPNLAIVGSIAPYNSGTDLYHYQYIGINYRSINEENNFSPISINTGMHRLINKTITGNDRWFQFGMDYHKLILNKKISFSLKNYFTKSESLKTIGFNYIHSLFNKLNLGYGIQYQFTNSNLSFNLNIEFPI